MKILFDLFFTFFKIGAFTFGGGYAMLPLVSQEVLRKGWMAQEDIMNFIAISESTPGPFAINMSTYVGYEMGGILGSVCATLGVVLPSFIVILIVAKMYEKFKQSRVVKGCMAGLKPAVVGLIGAAVISAASSAFTVLAGGALLSIDTLIEVSVFVVMLVLLLKKVSPFIIIIASAVIGIVTGLVLAV